MSLSLACAATRGETITYSPSTYATARIGDAFAPNNAVYDGPAATANAYGTHGYAHASVGVGPTGGTLNASGASDVAWGRAFATTGASWPFGTPLHIAYATTGNGFVIADVGRSGNGYITNNSGGVLLSADVSFDFAVGNGYGRAVLAWGFGDERDPIQSQLSQARKARYVTDDTRGADEPEETTGTRLTSLPVVENHGYTDFVLLEVGEQELAITTGTPLRFSSDIPVAQLKLPEIEGGSATYEVMFKGGQVRTIASGSTFDFTAVAPGGVNAFRIWPTEPTDLMPDAAAFLFASEGPTDVWQEIIIVPEPASIVLAAVACLPLWWMARRRHPCWAGEIRRRGTFGRRTLLKSCAGRFSASALPAHGSLRNGGVKIVVHFPLCD